MNKITLSALFAYSLANTVPIYGQYPGWIVGSGQTGIVVEIYLDLMCSDSKANNPIWAETLQTDWLNGTV